MAEYFLGAEEARKTSEGCCGIRFAHCSVLRASVASLRRNGVLAAQNAMLLPAPAPAKMVGLA